MEQALLTFRNVVKHYPGVVALKGVSLTLQSGKVVALLGENGAGKSTLVKILCGVIPYGEYEGEVWLKDKRLKYTDTREPLRDGIAMIPQEISVLPDLSIAENILLGNWPIKGMFVDEEKMNEIAREALRKLDFDIDVTRKAGTVTSGIQQMMSIARALLSDPSVLILDEPTSALTNKETGILLEKIIALRKQGICCLYITHKMDEVFKIADQCIVFRDGNLISEYDKVEMEPRKIIDDIVGVKKENAYCHECHATAENALSVRNFSVMHPYVKGKKLLNGVSFDLKKGEILGIAGLLGSGRSELMKAIFGALPKLSGELTMNGKKLDIRSPQDAIENGIGLLTENRGFDGYVKTMTVGENISLTILKKLKKRVFLDKKREKEIIDKYFRYIHIKAPSANTMILSLSGGNQQKALVAKWLTNAPQVLLLDEPTRGVDVGAREEIYSLMSDITGAGVSILIVSSELPELVKVCDRFIILSGGVITETLDNSKEKVSEAELMMKINRSENLM